MERVLETPHKEWYEAAQSVANKHGVEVHMPVEPLDTDEDGNCIYPTGTRIIYFGCPSQKHPGQFVASSCHYQTNECFNRDIACARAFMAVYDLKEVAGQSTEGMNVTD